MSKRQRKRPVESTVAKRQKSLEPKTEAEATALTVRTSSGDGRTATGDIGIIESITLRNFMCHHLLGPFHFGPNVNFIIGNNGSGKSAILTALIVGLGGKATVTNRGLSLKDFIKHGESTADIVLKLRNRGPDSFKGEVYGDSITVEHKIAGDGSRTYRLKNKSGQLVTNKKEELITMLDHFNIQLDNPVSILNQEMSKQFLHTKNETDKYKFFMKATLLDQMKRDYMYIKQTKTITRQQVERQEEGLKDLKQDYLRKKERYEQLSSFSELRDKLENLKKSMAWSLVREKEHSVNQLKEEIEREENNFKLRDNLQQWQTKVTQVEKRIQSVRSKLEQLKEEQEVAAMENKALAEEVKAVGKSYKEKELVYLRALNKVKQTEKEQTLLEEKINKAKTSVTPRSRGDQRRLSTLRETLQSLNKTCADLNQEVKQKHQAVLKGREERDKIRMEQKNIQVSIESKLKKKNHLLSSRSNKLRLFGDSVPELLSSIEKACKAGRFSRKPLGPIGACLSVKDPSLCVAVESCLRSFMKTFCCDNYKDEAVLQELMSQHYAKDRRPQIIVSPFTETLYNLQGRKAKHSEFPSVLDMISATSPVIINCLIDMRGIESVLIIKEKSKARLVMQRGRPPQNCKEAFTMEGDQVYPNRYYTSDFSMAKYLGGDIQAEISLLESELENHQAQLNRFQSQVTSVTEDIRSMERQLNQSIAALKKSQISMNQTKASIAELESVEEEKSNDLIPLNEVCAEVQLRAEEEKQTAAEAKKELDKQKKKNDEIETKFSTSKDRRELLTEEMESLKEVQQKVETECARYERNMKFIENKSKNQDENVQEMKSELAQREDELQDYEAKAMKICPERPQVKSSTKTIELEIGRLKKRLLDYESSHGDQETVVREYAEALALYRLKTSQVRDLKRFIDCLDNIMSDRQNRYKTLRRSLSVRCKLYFNNFLVKLNCNGFMMFDHNNETLSISVSPPGQEDDEVRDMRSLSGGERSFSTVCFMLSLWEITESPFRCLDEFDVYMDMHNRRISLDLLMELTERQNLRQFVFITPLGTSFLPRSSLIKIHQLENPEEEEATS
uniref:Structural maintenance of chromosomes protein 6 n=1 Tax=Neogobius melanostomus TaxID=47308 RepID=A0A8C6SPL9_9GOBI